MDIKHVTAVASIRDLPQSENLFFETLEEAEVRFPGVSQAIAIGLVKAHKINLIEFSGYELEIVDASITSRPSLKERLVDWLRVLKST